MYNRGMNTICLVVDRLHAGYLGPYGNCWISTPAFNRLAVDGFVFDQFLIDSPELANFYRSCWQGRHALSPKYSADEPSLAAVVAQAGTHTVLLADEPEVIRHPLAAGFQEILQIELPEALEPAPCESGTRLAQCFVRLIAQTRSLREPFLLWCHLRGLGSAWDAPLEYRERYVEPGDPQAQAFVEVPNRMLDPGFDPDYVLGISQAYAGQVSLLDTCLAGWADLFGGDVAHTLFILVSARGFPLGEHRRIGPCDHALYSELVHVPLLLRFADQRHAAGRSQALVEPADIWATILDWHGLAPPAGPLRGKSLLGIVREEASLVRDRLYVTGPRQRAIRTPAWYLRKCDAQAPAASDQAAADDPCTVELFVKPDDRWEANEVSARAGEAAALLRQVIRDYEQAAQDAARRELMPLNEILISGLE